MDSRMEKYNSEKPTLKKRTEKNKDLYKNINEGYITSDFDLNSNMTVLNTDSRVIDVDKIRDMLDRRYRVDESRRHIEIPQVEDKEIEISNTKEYDINSILEKAKKSKNFDYEKERLKSVHNTQYDILKKLDIPQDNEEKVSEDEENLVNLINTITALELKNKNNKKKHEEALEMLTDFDGEDEEKNDDNIISENTFTNNKILNFENEDYEEFEDLKNDIKSNSILIKIVGILFVLILLVGALILANNYFDLGLF